MVESRVSQGVSITEINSNPLDAAVQNVTHRINTLIDWKLNYGLHHMVRIPPPQRARTPREFEESQRVNAIDLTFPYEVRSNGLARMVRITKGLTEKGAAEGIEEDIDDLSVEIDGRPKLLKFRKSGASVESRRYVYDPPYPEVDDWHSKEEFVRRRYIPESTRPMTHEDVAELETLLDNAIGNDNVSVVETHRNRITQF